LKRGKPANDELTNTVLSLIQPDKLYNIEKIRQLYKGKYNRNISWNTVRYHVNILLRKGYVKEDILTQGDLKKVSTIRRLRV